LQSYSLIALGNEIRKIEKKRFIAFEAAIEGEV